MFFDHVQVPAESVLDCGFINQVRQLLSCSDYFLEVIIVGSKDLAEMPFLTVGLAILEDRSDQKLDSGLG